MLDSWLSKSKINELLEKAVKRLIYKKISPNTITIIGLILGLLSALSIFLSSILDYFIELTIHPAEEVFKGTYGI